MLINFVLAYKGKTTGAMWYVTGLLGIFGIVSICLLINHNILLQYLGRISIVILCVHGPIYRIIVKIISILVHMETNGVRENFILSMIVIVVTLAISALIYELMLMIAPWMIGKKDDFSIRLWIENRKEKRA